MMAYLATGMTGTETGFASYGVVVVACIIGWRISPARTD